MKKISINMLSKADSVKGQGVGSAYLEQVKLVSEGANDIFDITVNDWKDTDIIHHHTIEPMNYLRMKTGNSINVSYVHFLPETLDGSINIPKPAFDIFKKYVVDFYKSSDYLVVVNPIFIKELEQLGIESSKIKYIPNYVSKTDFNKKSKKEVLELRKELNIDKDAFVVVGVGQVQSRKGVLDFIEVANKRPDITFLWCGGFSFGAITDGYKELKKVYENPPKNVRFLGIIPREQMNDMYNIADCLFMPSYNELFPMSILEASNVEIPILLRDLELYEDILFGNYLVGNNNEEFSNQLDKLKNDKNLYKEYCLKSKNINEFYSKENVLKIWRDFYTSIYNDSVSDHLIFISKKQYNLLIDNKIKMLIRGNMNGKGSYFKAKKGDTIYIVEKDLTGNIKAKAIIKDISIYNDLEEEEALNIILDNQKYLSLNASDIKKWASKSNLVLIELKDIEIIEPFKIDECDYVNIEDWLTLKK